jgi:hypothetical protein
MKRSSFPHTSIEDLSFLLTIERPFTSTEMKTQCPTLLKDSLRMAEIIGILQKSIGKSSTYVPNPAHDGVRDQTDIKRIYLAKLILTEYDVLPDYFRQVITKKHFHGRHWTVSELAIALNCQDRWSMEILRDWLVELHLAQKNKDGLYISSVSVQRLLVKIFGLIVKEAYLHYAKLNPLVPISKIRWKIKDSLFIESWLDFDQYWQGWVQMGAVVKYYAAPTISAGQGLGNQRGTELVEIQEFPHIQW